MKHTRASLGRRISDFCRARITQLYPPREAERITHYLMDLVRSGERPPSRGQEFDYAVIAQACGLDQSSTPEFAKVVRPALVAIQQDTPPPKPKKVPSNAQATGGTIRASKSAPNVTSDKSSKRRGQQPHEPMEFPSPLFDEWDEPASFCEALDLHMRRHGDSSYRLQKAVAKEGDTFNRTTLMCWRRGDKAPRGVESFRILKRIEHRYRLPAGYFKALLPHPGRSATGHQVAGIGDAERRRLAWHLPDDFAERSPEEQEVILEWVRRVIVSGSTDYRRYQSAAMKTRFGLRFPGLLGEGEVKVSRQHLTAPPSLAEEMGELIAFKTAVLTPRGLVRSGVWGPDTAAQKLEHFGLLFGALAAPVDGPVRGFGAPRDAMTFALLALPATWDWYVAWREQRRGFYTAWETDLLHVAASLTRPETGWLRQRTDLAERLKPIEGLVGSAECELASGDWAGQCDRAHAHVLARAKEIERVVRVHRDPFEAVLPVLEADSPLGEYRKIANEIVRLMPDERRYPIACAEAMRALLMLRFGMHLGLRQKNLRQLRVCAKGHQPTPERRLEQLKVGELRWNECSQGWEVYIPSVAFKNSHSSFFGSKPFRLVLPDLGDLYQHIDAYIDRHRRRLLRGAPDPGTFFVKTAKRSSTDAAYDQNTFYEAWRWAIQRYGIFNPYTGRGAIKGLLPHGPHNVRDVLATHILKQTGSYEQASYAIQDTPEMVAQHYGRFLPQDKAELAAKVLNLVWEAA